ncbi:Hsp70 family protein [Plantactinospora siamensis]|uniref:Hsp70 family protein n=1 Tax=Plantactinospora siamensis TaxID=555372 RepID=A0ABV6NW76_9ACTN
MGSPEARLAVDYGAVGTTAVLVWSDGRSSVLTFDGSDVLPSAVLVDTHGEVVTGQQAWRAASEYPERFVASPTTTGAEQLDVAGRQVPAADLVAATVRRVAEEVARVADGPVRDVRLVVPAGWGPRRRTWFRQAVHRAGLGQAQLVEAPVAVAEHLLASGIQILVGGFLVVVDVGAGCEVSVLRRGPAGFEVLSTLHDPQAGGQAVDEALLTALQANVPADGAGHDWASLAAARTAKEALSQHPAVTVPLNGSMVVLGADLLDRAASPTVTRVADLAVEAIGAAEIDPSQIAGLWCVGGSANLPLVEKVLAERTGIAPVTLADPATAAVRGAAGAGIPDTSTAEAVDDAGAALPPVRRALGIVLPGLASLAMAAQFLTTATKHSGIGYWVIANWAELALAGVLATVACLGSGSILAALIANRGATAPMRAPGSQVAMGLLAAASLSVAISAMYAVLASAYLEMPIGPYLRWALLPVAPLAVLTAVAATVAARQWRTPRGGWYASFAVPTASVAAAAAGMLLMQYAFPAAIWVDADLLPLLMARGGGLLMGAAMVMAITQTPILRLIVGLPVAVISAAVYSDASMQLLGVAYTIALAVGYASRLWTAVVPIQQPPTGARR